jgi:hypothetical protein
MGANTGVVTFAGGSPRWYLAGIRLMRQCKYSVRPIYSELFTPRRLSQILDSKTREFINANPKGFGYWVWKPYVIIDFLENNPNLEYLLYLDAGCELQINSTSVQNWDRYINLLQEFGCLTFDNGQTEDKWTKKELIDYLDASASQASSNQLAAGVLFMRREFALSFCKEWISVMQKNDFFFITDEVNRNIQLESFIENRYDQSVISLLLKKNDRNYTLSGNEEIHFPGNWEENRAYPIWTIRNASIVPTVNRSIAAKYVRIFEKLLHLLFKAYIRTFKAKR